MFTDSSCAFQPLFSCASFLPIHSSGSPHMFQPVSSTEFAVIQVQINSMLINPMKLSSHSLLAPPDGLSCVGHSLLAQIVDPLFFCNSINFYFFTAIFHFSLEALFTVSSLSIQLLNIAVSQGPSSLFLHPSADSIHSHCFRHELTLLIPSETFKEGYL